MPSVETEAGLSVQPGDGTFAGVCWGRAPSIVRVAVELVINAVKHAFPASAGGSIIVGYETSADRWHLSVSDNGVGVPVSTARAPVHVGLGTSIVESLSRQLGGRIETVKGSPGTTVIVSALR